MENLRPRAGYDPAFELTELPLTVPVLACLMANMYVFAQAWASAVRLTFHERRGFISAHSLADALSFHVLDSDGCGAHVAELMGADCFSPCLTIERFAAVLDALKADKPDEHALANAALDAAEKLISTGFSQAASAESFITDAYNLGMDYLCARDPEFEIYLAASGHDTGNNLYECGACACGHCFDVREGRTLFAQWTPPAASSPLQRLHTMIATFYALDASARALNTHSGSSSDDDDDSEYVDPGNASDSYSSDVYDLASDFDSDSGSGGGEDVGDAAST